jgi:hypothetical protein
MAMTTFLQITVDNKPSDWQASDDMRETTMTTQRQEHSFSACYFGDNPDWLITCAMNRDSDALGRSDFRCFERALKALPEVKEWAGEFTPVTVERSSHWAVGWVDYLIIDPACTAAVALAEQMRERLEDYPVLDEDDFSELEQEEAAEVWANCYRERERIDYIRKHRSQFEFADWLDMLSCVRGRYFAGYASELLH